MADILTKIAEFWSLAAEKKLDPKAKVRNRGKVVFRAESPKIKDNKDHFELNSEKQGRAALSYAGHYSKVPPWYDGSLEELKAAIRRAVHKEFPSIDISEPKKKKSSELAAEFLAKYAEDNDAVEGFIKRYGTRGFSWMVKEFISQLPPLDERLADVANEIVKAADILHIALAAHTPAKTSKAITDVALKFVMKYGQTPQAFMLLKMHSGK